MISRAISLIRLPVKLIVFLLKLTSLVSKVFSELKRCMAVVRVKVDFLMDDLMQSHLMLNYQSPAVSCSSLLG